ncbi:MAG: hypothetical protein B7Z73_17850 [Planctomycetia bacterium 21-64-5]|nr:MAG: hypothetical protein B7Z73_17850 [Planctomycetia bacterium 21-64-5]HQU46181.1 hypothetical protein [Pirellulales bacterium]
MKRRGVVVMMALVCLVLATAMGGTLLRWAAMEHKLLRSRERESQAHWLAEAGIGRAVARLAEERDYRGETWEIAAADLSAGEAAKVSLRVAAIDEGRRSIEVDVEYPSESVEAVRVHKGIVYQPQPEK